ncbi:MAG TPA: hypothetical protein VF258_01665 [Luteolibacter sp.]
MKTNSILFALAAFLLPEADGTMETTTPTHLQHIGDLGTATCCARWTSP